MSPTRSPTRTGKYGGRMNSSNASAQRETLLGRAVDVELRALTVDRRTERQTLHVVPVEMGDQGMSVERAVVRLGLTEEPQAGAEIEHHGFAARNVDGHTRGVAAVTTVRLA